MNTSLDSFRTHLNANDNAGPSQIAKKRSPSPAIGGVLGKRHKSTNFTKRKSPDAGYEWFELPKQCASLSTGSDEFKAIIDVKMVKVREDFLRQGRRIVGYPKLRDGGIIFDWEKIEGLPFKLDWLTVPLKLEDPRLKSESDSNVVGNSASNAIVIPDSDDDEIVEIKQQPKPPQASASIEKRSGSHEATRPTLPQADIREDSVIPTEHDVEVEYSIEDLYATPAPPEHTPDTHAPPDAEPRAQSNDVQSIRDNEAAGVASPDLERTSHPKHVSDPEPSSDSSSGEWEEGGLDYQPVPIQHKQRKTVQPVLRTRRRDPSESPEAGPSSKKPSSRGRRKSTPQRPSVNAAGPSSKKPVSNASKRRQSLSERSASLSTEDSDTDDPAPPANRRHILEIPIPPGEYKRARRLLKPQDRALPLMTVDIRSNFQFINRPKCYRKAKWSMPCLQVDRDIRRVEDAVMIQNTAVIGYSFNIDKHEPFQVTIVPPADDGPPQRVNIPHIAHSVVREKAVGAAERNQGIMTLAAVDGNDDRFRFVSGGHDGRVYLWTMRRDDDGTPEYHARTQETVIRHASRVLSLAYRPSDGLLFSSAGKLLSTASLRASSSVKSKSVSMSHHIHQIHIHPKNDKLVLFEVDHLNMQMQLFDTRQSGFDSNPAVQFGWRSGRSRISNRHTRGTCSGTAFVRGYGDGAVKVWDIRAAKNAVLETECQSRGAVSHTIFSGSHVAAYSAEHVTFLERL